MIKSQKAGSKQQINLKQLEYKVTISQVKILSQSIKTQCYLLLKSSLTGREWKSQLFYAKLPHPWTLDVDSPILILQLFNKEQNTFSKIGKCTLSEGNSIVTLSHLSNKNNKIFVFRYELTQQEKSQKALKGNYFHHDSNIFDCMMNQNQISRVEHVKTNQQSFERVRFDGYSYISSQVSQSQQGGQNQSKVMKQNNSHLKVVNDNKHSESDERQRFEGTFNDTINMSFNDSKSDIKQIIGIIVPKQKNIEHINQQPSQGEDQFITTSEKWYEKRFNKKNMKLKRRKTYLNQASQQQQEILDPKQVRVQAFNSQIVQKEQIIRQLSDISCQSSLRLKTIDFSLSEDGQTKKLYSLSRVDGKQSSLWYTTVSLPSQRTILIECQSQNGILNGCLGRQQIKKCQCPLYDQQGNINGNLTFKWKSICNFQVQTSQTMNYDNSNLLQNQNELNINHHKQKLEQESIKKNKQSIQQQKDPNIHQFQNNKQRSTSPIMLINFSSNASKVQNESDVQRSGKNEFDKERQQRQINNQNPNIQTMATSQVQKVQTGRLNFPLSIYYPRKQRYFNKPQQDDSEIRNKPKIQSKIQTIQTENSPNTQTISQHSNNMPKQTQQSRFNIKKRSLSQYHTISEEIKPQYRTKGQEIKLNPQENSDKNSPSPRDVNKQQNQQKKEFGRKGEQKEEKRQVSNHQVSSYRRGRMQSYNPLTYNDQQQSIKSNETPVYNNSFSYRLDKYVNNRQSYNNSSRERSHANYTRQILNEEVDGDQQNDKYKRENYSQIARNSITSRKDKLLNFKISNIKLTLHKPIYNTKFLRMRVQRKEHFTETTRDYCFMNWKGNGYVFLQVSEFSILYIDLIEERDDGQVVTARCKIQLPLLQLSSINKTFSHYDYLRKQNQQSVGRIQINYETFQRRGKSLQTIHNSFVELQSIKKHRINYSTIENNQQVPRNKKNKRSQLKSHKQSGVNEARRVPLNLGKASYGQQYNILSRLKNRPPLVKRKYTGGNTLIPKASRFREQTQVKKLIDGPGPGAYQIQSSFDRHASPY